MRNLLSASDSRVDHLERIGTEFAQLPVPVAHFAVKTGQFISANQALCDLLGYSEQDLLLKTATEIAHPEDRAPVAEILNLRQQAPCGRHSAEKRFLKKSGDLIWTRIETQLVGCAPDYLVAVICDITTEKKAYAALEDSLTLVRQREQELDLAASSGEVGVWDWDLITNDVLMSPLQREIMGIPLDQRVITFNDFTDRVLMEDREMLGQKVKVAFDGHQDYRAEFRIVRNGEIRWLTGRGRIIRGLNDEALRMVGVNCDVTEFRREARERDELIVRERTATTSSKLKSEFLANMSHELRTPLNGVLGLAGLLLNTELSPKQKSYAQMIVKSGDTLLFLVNDILDLSKVEAGQLKIETLEFKIANSIKDLLGTLTFAAQEKGIALIYKDVGVEFPTLRGDAARLCQVLNNLLGNAIKFSAGGAVSLAVKILEETKQDLTLRFEVVDSGIGIAPDAIERLFKPFSQEDSSTTRRYGGTGLGLSICKHLVELMNGTIGVASELGIGSTFWFEIKFQKIHQ